MSSFQKRITNVSAQKEKAAPEQPQMELSITLEEFLAHPDGQQVVEILTNPQFVEALSFIWQQWNFHEGFSPETSLPVPFNFQLPDMAYSNFCEADWEKTDLKSSNPLLKIALESDWEERYHSSSAVIIMGKKHLDTPETGKQLFGNNFLDRILSLPSLKIEVSATDNSYHIQPYIYHRSGDAKSGYSYSWNYLGAATQIEEFLDNLSRYCAEDSADYYHKFYGRCETEQEKINRLKQGKEETKVRFEQGQILTASQETQLKIAHQRAQLLLNNDQRFQEITANIQDRKLRSILDQVGKHWKEYRHTRPIGFTTTIHLPSINIFDLWYYGEKSQYSNEDLKAIVDQALIKGGSIFVESTKPYVYPKEHWFVGVEVYLKDGQIEYRESHGGAGRTSQNLTEMIEFIKEGTTYNYDGRLYGFCTTSPSDSPMSSGDYP